MSQCAIETAEHAEFITERAFARHVGYPRRRRRTVVKVRGDRRAVSRGVDSVTSVATAAAFVTSENTSIQFDLISSLYAQAAQVAITRRHQP
jgi:hypothetical protein